MNLAFKQCKKACCYIQMGLNPMVFVSDQADGAHLPTLKFSNGYEPSLHLLSRLSCRGRKAWSKAFATRQDHCMCDLYLYNSILCDYLIPYNWAVQAGLFLCQGLPRFLRDRPIISDKVRFCDHFQVRWLVERLLNKPIKYLVGVIIAG